MKPFFFRRRSKFEIVYGFFTYNFFILLFSHNYISKLEMIKYFKTGEFNEFKQFQLNEIDNEIRLDLLKYINN